MQFECIFLDRDGVINRERADYVKSWEEFELLPGSLEALIRLAVLDIPIIIITNQSAIGRGAVRFEVVDDIHNRLIAQVQQLGGRLDEVILCPHHPDEICSCRKPKPGMLLQAAHKYGFVLNHCIFVGDAITDYQAAMAIGCKSILVKSGRQADQIESLVDSYLLLNGGMNNGMIRPEIVDNFSSAVERILSRTVQN